MFICNMGEGKFKELWHVYLEFKQYFLNNFLIIDCKLILTFKTDQSHTVT